MNSTNRRLLALVGVLALLLAVKLAYDWWKEQRFDPLIAEAGRRYHLDPALIKAVIWRESRFRPWIHGHAGELGLMQIREAAAREWAAAEKIPSFDHTACLDPGTNILAGTWYLKKALDRYPAADDPSAFALAEYNAGRGNVLKWEAGASATNRDQFISHIQFPSTHAYVLAILRRAERYREKGDFKP